MIVIVADHVFGSADPLHLAVLLRMAFEGRHRLLIDPPWSPSNTCDVNRWLEQQSRVLHEHAEQALQRSIEDDVMSFPMASTLRVEDISEPVWESDPPQLPLAEALRIIERPLSIMVEDEENDGAFLVTVAPSELRGKLLQVFDDEWVTLKHGGGLSRMYPRLRTIRSDGEQLRLWVLFDSDSREPGKPSDDSQTIREVCEDTGIGFHQLRRRAAENYLPLPALAAWVYNSPRNTQSKRRKTYHAFKEMNREQRYHYNMRNGFVKDEPEGIPELFGELPNIPELRNGFGRTIRALFKQEDFRFQEQWLLKDGQQEEARAMIRSILRRL